MDANGTISILRQKNGFTIIWLALLFPVILLFAAMAVDFGYMYMAKGQLQNAADSAALAGAAKLNPTFINQTSARNEAIKFASSNKAATLPVILASNTSENAFTPTNDFIFGLWDDTSKALTPYTSPSDSINAVQVKARRDVVFPNQTTIHQRQVPIIFGRYFGWEKMSASATATAWRPPPPTLPVSLCISSCSLSVPRSFYFNQSMGGPKQHPANETLGWTNFSETQPANKQNIRGYIDGTLKPPDMCNKKINTTNGNDNDLIKSLQDEFNAKKDATGWEVIIPIFSDTTDNKGNPVTACPPGDQPNPYLLSQYAKVRITAVETPADPYLTIDQIQCLSCTTTFMGSKAVLCQ